MFRRKGLMMVAVSLAMGLAAAWMANGLIEARALSNDGSSDTVAVLTAAVAIQMGQQVAPMHVETVQVPPQMVPVGAITDPLDVEGKVALQPIFAGEYLRKERFADHNEGSTLAAVITPRKRAVSIRVNDVVGVAGFLLPGNHVDVVASRKENRRAVTETILTRIRVLAVDQTASTDKNEPVVVRAVTLEMTPEEAEILVKGQEEGSIQLTLRNPQDDEVIEIPTPEIEKPAPVVAAAKPVRKARPKSTRSSVTVIRGTSVKTTRVKN